MQWRVYSIQPKRPLSALTEQIKEKREFALWMGGRSPSMLWRIERGLPLGRKSV